MPSFEAVCRRLLGKAGWMPKALWGGAFTFVPLVNFLSFGYLLEYVLKLNRTQDSELPEWRDFSVSELLLSGGKFFGLLVGYSGIPILAGWILSRVLEFITMDLLGVLTFAPLGIGTFAGTFLFITAISEYAKDGLYQDAWRFREVFTLAMNAWKGLLLPVFAFWGLCLLALPLYGFAFFTGAWILLSYSTLLLSETNGSEKG